MQQGWIKLHRKIQDHWTYKEKRKFSRYEAWLDLLMMANHKDTKIVLGNELVELKKGEFITSEKKLMESWNWGKSKTRAFLQMLENDGMIVKKSDRKKTTITICNYSVYHDSENESRPQSDRNQSASGLSADTDKNVKNDKNDKDNIPFADIVNYLNQKAEKKFRHTTKKTKEVIKARWNDGFREDDFYRVIDICCLKWKGQIFGNGANGDDYLQPSTLFNNKFEERLNWTAKVTDISTKKEKKKSIDQIKHEQMLRENGLI